MKYVILLVLLFCWLPPALAGAGEPLDFQTERVRLGYSIGYLVGGDFLKQQRQLDEELLLRGIADAQDGGEPLLTTEQMRESLARLQKEMARREPAKTGKPAAE